MIDDKARDEKLQYHINREAGKISALSSGEIDKYEYLTVEEILHSNRSQIIGQATFTYSPLGEALEKQIKTIENQGYKQKKAIEEHGKQHVESNAIVNKKDYQSHSKKIVERITAKNKSEINALNKLISLRNLTYQFKNKELIPKRFRYFDAQLGFLRKLTDGDTLINKAIKKQKKLNQAWMKK